MTTAGMIWTGFQSVRFWRWSMWIIWCHVCRSEDLWPKTSDCWSSPSPHNPVHQGNVHTGFNRSWWSLLANDHQNNMPLFSTLFPPLFSHWYFFSFICLMVSFASCLWWRRIRLSPSIHPHHWEKRVGKKEFSYYILLYYTSSTLVPLSQFTDYDFWNLASTSYHINFHIQTIFVYMK